MYSNSWALTQSLTENMSEEFSKLTGMFKLEQYMPKFILNMIMEPCYAT